MSDSKLDKIDAAAEAWETKTAKVADPLMSFARAALGLYLMLHALIATAHHHNEWWMYGLGLLLCWTWNVDRALNKALSKKSDVVVHQHFPTRRGD